jgi:hypothetical protein
LQKLNKAIFICLPGHAKSKKAVSGGGRRRLLSSTSILNPGWASHILLPPPGSSFYGEGRMKVFRSIISFSTWVLSPKMLPPLAARGHYLQFSEVLSVSVHPLILIIRIPLTVLDF